MIPGHQSYSIVQFLDLQVLEMAGQTIGYFSPKFAVGWRFFSLHTSQSPDAPVHMLLMELEKISLFFGTTFSLNFLALHSLSRKENLL